MCRANAPRCEPHEHGTARLIELNERRGALTLEEELPIRKLWQALKNAAFYFDRFTTSRAELA